MQKKTNFLLCKVIDKCINNVYTICERRSNANKDFKQGDIVFMDFNPTKGYEQSGNRVTVVISNDDYQTIMGLNIVCPITNNEKEFPSHVPLDSQTEITGSVLCEHIRTVDLVERNSVFKERIPEYILKEILDIVQSCF
ncbi:MAG: type II toxin-antitoxin system PemK/MazF family toxin [Bacilli bacterium]|nr:type II toxin-antitoxin system PemK/MazF family toxin [Bacilli bacterium]